MRDGRAPSVPPSLGAEVFDETPPRVATPAWSFFLWRCGPHQGIRLGSHEQAVGAKQVFGEGESRVARCVGARARTEMRHIPEPIIDALRKQFRGRKGLG